jgi:hypothetical protein
MRMKGFSPSWCAWIHTIVSRGHVRVKANDGVGLFFSTFKGLRRGDPLSSILFNIVADMLAILFARAKEENLFKKNCSTFDSGGFVYPSVCWWYGGCRRFDPGGSLDRRVNCRRVPQPRWVGARQNTKGGETAKGKPATSVLSCAQVGCACSRGLQASARERARALCGGPFSRAANLLVREPWTFLL